MGQAFQVEGMSCGHCRQVVTEAVRSVDPQAQVAVSLDDGRVEVESERAPDDLARAIEDAGYRARPIA